MKLAFILLGKSIPIRNQLEACDNYFVFFKFFLKKHKYNTRLKIKKIGSIKKNKILIKFTRHLNKHAKTLSKPIHNTCTIQTLESSHVRSLVKTPKKLIIQA